VSPDIDIYYYQGRRKAKKVEKHYSKKYYMGSRMNTNIKSLKIKINKLEILFMFLVLKQKKLHVTQKKITFFNISVFYWAKYLLFS